MRFSHIKQAVVKSWKKDTFFYSALIIISIVAAFLRFYRLEEFITFLGDQGRDAIIIKRIVTLEDFPGIGARSSVGNIFLGPFYYYLMAPFLFLFQLNPLGPAFGVAFLSLTGLIVGTIIVRREVNIPAAITFALLVTFSYANVWLSRFSWNPNLLPVFSFFTLYFCCVMFRKKHFIHAFLFGAFLAASLQLHYLMLLVLPAIGISLMWNTIRERKHLITVVQKLAISAVGFGIVLAPLIVFDIKNDFLNIKGMMGMFTDKHLQSTTSYYNRLLGSANQLLHHTLQIEIPSWGANVLIAAVVVGTIWLLYKRRDSSFIVINALALLTFLFAFALIDAERYLHYYTPVYYSLFVFVAYFVGIIPHKFVRIAAIVLIIGLYCWVNVPKYPIWQKEGNFQTRISDSIAKQIINMGVKSPYYLVSIPFVNTNDHIRYYLELRRHRPLPDDTLDMAEELVILCYDKGPKGCDVMNDAQYLVVKFGDRKIAKIERHPEVMIYRLIHAK